MADSSRACVRHTRAVTGPRQPPRHVRRTSTGRRVARTVAITAGVIALGGATGAAALYHQVAGGIDRADVDQFLADDRPDTTEPAPEDGYAGQPLNILVMGTDSRDGENAAIAGDEDGMRSDTTVLVHLSADRTRVELVSIPRDSLVRIPSCTLEDGSTTRSQESAMFNSAFTIGAGDTGNLAAAAAWTRRTFEESH